MTIFILGSLACAAFMAFVCLTDWGPASEDQKIVNPGVFCPLTNATN